MVEFWWSVIQRAFWDSISAIGQTKGQLIFGVLIIIIGALWVKYKEGWHAVKSMIIQAVKGSPFIAILAWFVFFIFYLLIQTPYVRFDEERQRANSAERVAKEKDGTINTLQKTIQYLEAELDQKRKLLSGETQSNRRSEAELARLRADHDRREKRKGIRTEISKFIDEGAKLLKAFLVKEEKKDLVSSVVNWNKKASSYLASIEPSFASRFNSSSSSALSYTGIPDFNDNYARFLEARIQVLSTLLSELRD
jgi:hypothetical protein